MNRRESLHATYYNYIGEKIGEEDVPFVTVEVYPFDDSGFILTCPKYPKLPIFTTVILEHKEFKEYFTITKVVGDKKYTLKNWLQANFNIDFYNSKPYGGEFRSRTFGDLMDLENENIISEPYPISSCTFNGSTGEKVGCTTIANFKFALHEFNLNGNALVGGYPEDYWKDIELYLMGGIDTQTPVLNYGTIYIRNSDGQQVLSPLPVDEVTPYWTIHNVSSHDAIFNLWDSMYKGLRPKDNDETDPSKCFVLDHEEIDGRLHMTCKILIVAFGVVPYPEFPNQILDVPIDGEKIDLSKDIYFDIVTPEIGQLKTFEYLWDNHEEDLVQEYREDITYTDLLGQEVTTTLYGQVPQINKPTANFLYEDKRVGAMNANRLSAEDIANGAWLNTDTYLTTGIQSPIRGKPIKLNWDGTIGSDDSYNFGKESQLKDQKYTFEFSIPNNRKTLFLKQIQIGMRAKLSYPGYPELLVTLNSYEYNEYFTRYIFGTERADILRIMQKKVN